MTKPKEKPWIAVPATVQHEFFLARIEKNFHLQKGVLI